MTQFLLVLVFAATTIAPGDCVIHIWPRPFLFTENVTKRIERIEGNTWWVRSWEYPRWGKVWANPPLVGPDFYKCECPKERVQP